MSGRLDAQPPVVDIILYRDDAVDIQVTLDATVLTGAVTWKAQVRESKQGTLRHEVVIADGSTETQCVLIFESADTRALCDLTPAGKPWTGVYDVQQTVGTKKRTVVQGSITVVPDTTLEAGA